MNSANTFPSATPQTSETQSFGAHRQSDRPASAVRAGATTMPMAWQARGVSSVGERPSDVPARALTDLMLDPVRWAVSTPAHKIGSGLVVVLGLFIFL